MSSHFSYWNDPNYLEKWFGYPRNMSESTASSDSTLQQNPAEEVLPAQAENPPPVLQEKKITESAKTALPKQRKYEKKKDPVVFPEIKRTSEDPVKSPQKKVVNYRIKQEGAAQQSATIAPPISQGCEESSLSHQKSQQLKIEPKKVLKPVVNSVAIDALNGANKKREYSKESHCKANVTDTRTHAFTKKNPPFNKNEIKPTEIKTQSEQRDSALESNLSICLSSETKVPKIISLDHFEPHSFTREELLLFYLSVDFEPLLRQVAGQKRLQIYCQLIQICVSGLTFEKNQKASTTTLNHASNLLSKHQKLLGELLIDPKEPLIYQLLYPLVEMCVKSSSVEACCTGLSFLNLLFNQKFEKKNCKEVQLAEYFLIQHKNVLQKVISNEIDTEKVWTDRLKTETKDLFKVLLENVAEIKHAELAISNEDSELSIKYMLKWLEKIYGPNQEGLMPQHKVFCDYLIKKIQTCEPSHFQLIFDFFHQLPQESVNFNITPALIQSVYRHLYIRKFQSKLPSKNLKDVVLELSKDLWKLTPQTISEISPVLNIFFSEIESRDRGLAYLCHQFLLNAMTMEVASQELKSKKQTMLQFDKKIVADTPKNIKSPLGNVRGKKNKGRAVKKTAPISNLSVDHHQIHYDAVSNLFHLVFQSIQKVLPTDEVVKKEEMEKLWGSFRDLKDHFNIKLTNSSFLHDYIQCCCKANSYDEALATEIILGYLQDVPEAIMTLHHLPHEKPFSDLLQKCIYAGVKTFCLKQKEERGILFKNLLALTEQILRSEVDSQDKTNTISALLCIFRSAENRIQFASEVYRVFKTAKPFYKTDFLYWMHYYRLGEFDGKDPLTELQNSPEQLEIRRQSLLALMELYLKEGDLSSLDQTIAILWGKDTVEFKGHFIRLVPIYDSLLNHLEVQNKKTLPDAGQDLMFHNSLIQVMNLWVGCQCIKTSIFSRVNLETGVREYLNEEEQKAHRELMLKFISTYVSICRTSSDKDKDRKKEFGKLFLDNIRHLANIKTFEIFYREDLDSFGKILNCICTFILDQKIQFFSAKILSDLYAEIQNVFSRSAVKGQALESLKRTYEEQWKKIKP